MRARWWIVAAAMVTGIAAAIAQVPTPAPPPGAAPGPDAPAGVPDDLRRGVARVSFLNGDASVLRGDSGDWVAAVLNAPLMSNDRISTGMNSRMEIEFNSGDIMRIGGAADVTLTDLEANRFQIALGHGTVTFRVLRAGSADIELDTPSVSVRPSQAGTYRISVSDNGESQIAARSGNVEVFTPRGSQWVSQGQMMLAQGTQADPEFQIVQAPAPDDWDRWSDSRDRPIVNSPSQQYVPPGVYGTESLDGYGNWVNVPQYGYVWQPTVAVGWAPYRYGRWAWLDWYGWSWISYDPWGWAPYHYGRWFYASTFGWCWYPGALGIYHYWSPALVAFFGFGAGGGFGFGIGFGNVGWVPLAPFEALHPWWGRGFYGNFGLNRQANFASVNVFNTYRNARVTNGFTAVSGTDFRSGRFSNFVRPQSGELNQASLARGPLPIGPERANLGFSERPATTIARSAAPRVYSYRGGTATQSVQRIPFAQQQRAFGGGTAAAAAPANRGWTRFGEPSANNPSAMGGWRNAGERSPSEGTSGIGRFGEPYGTQRQPNAPAPRTEAPRSFGGQNYGGTASRPEPLRVAPPVVRERPGGTGAPGGNGAASRPSSGGGFNRPTPGSSAPRTAPRSGGGGARSSGGSHGGRR
jgi:hypothetical protein